MREIAPIRVRCEGSNTLPLHGYYVPAGGDGVVTPCPMCGNYVPVDDGDAIEGHDRDDVLAMIDRGDCGR